MSKYGVISGLYFHAMRIFKVTPLANLRPCQTSIMELFYKIINKLNTVNYYREKTFTVCVWNTSLRVLCCLICIYDLEKTGAIEI